MSNLSAGTLAVRVPWLRFPPGFCGQSPPGQVLGPHALEIPDPIPIFTRPEGPSVSRWCFKVRQVGRACFLGGVHPPVCACGPCG